MCSTVPSPPAHDEGSCGKSLSRRSRLRCMNGATQSSTAEWMDTKTAQMPIMIQTSVNSLEPSCDGDMSPYPTVDIVTVQK